MKKVLAIDDIKDNLTTITAVIKSHLPNCIVLTAMSGKEGIALAQKEQPDTILLDIVMPKMDGYEVCQKLKADPLTKHIPIVMVTALKTDSESRIKGLNLGADAFLSKPIDATELATQIRVMLRIKEAEDQLRKEKKSLEELVEAKTKGLAENEKQFRLIAENTSDNISITTSDLKAKYLYVSPSVNQVLGYNAEDLLGKSFFDFIHPEDKKKLYPSLKEYIDQKNAKPAGGKELPTSNTVEFRFRNKAGNWRYLQSALNIVNKNILAVSRDITAQKQAEEALRVSEEKYKALYEYAPLPYQSLNEDGSFKDVNPEWLKTLGYDRKEVIGKFYKDFLHPDWQAHFEKNFPEFKKRGYISDVQFRIKHKKGNYLDITFEGCIAYHPDGSFKQTYCVFKDITEQKKAEQSVLESEEIFRSLVTNSSDLIFLTDADSTVTYLSPQCEAVIGHSPDNLIGINIPDFIHPNDKNMTRDKWERVYRDKKDIREFEYRILDNKNNVQWVSHSTKTIIIGGQIKFVHNTIRNITNQKLAENELQESKAHLQTLIETIPDLVWMKDPNGRYLTCNKRFESFFGAPKSEITGKTDYDFVDKELADFFRKNDKAALEAGEALMNEEEVQFADDGHYEILETLKTPVRDKNSNIIGVLGVGRNVSDRIKTENKLKQSEERYQSFIRQSREGIYRMELEMPMDITLPINDQIDFINQNAYYAECNDSFVKMYEAKSSDEIINVTRIEFNKDKNDETSRANLKKFIDSGYQIFNAESLEIVNGIEFKWFSNNTIGIVENGFLVRIWGTQLCITDRKKAEQDLKDSEVRFKELVELLPEAVIETDQNLKITYVNQKAYEISGYSLEDFEKGIKGLDLLIPEDRPKAAQIFDQRKDGVNPGIVEYKAIKKDGTIFNILFHGSVIRKNGHFAGLRAIIVDITDKKRAEEKLLESKSQYESLFNQIADPVAVFDQETKMFLHCNQAMIKKYGFSLDELKEMTPLSLHPNDSDKEQILRNIDDTEQTSPNEYLHQAKDGTIFQVETHTQDIIYEGQESWITIIRDITERKKILNDLKKSEQDYRGLFENAHDAIIIFEADKEIVLDVNQRACDIYGFSRDEFIGMSLKSISKDPAKGEEHLKKTLEEGFYNAFETIQFKKDGSPIIIEVNASLTEYGGIKAILSNNRDITLRKRTEKESVENAEKYRVLYTSTNDAIFLMQGNKFISCNPPTLKMYKCEKRNNWPFAAGFLTENSA